MQMKLLDGTVQDSRAYLEGLGFKVRKSPKDRTYVVSGLDDDVREASTGRFRGIEDVQGALIFIVDEEENMIRPVVWSLNK